MFDYTNHVFYWKDKNQYEVDYILYNGKDIEVPIEVKYGKEMSTKDKLTGFFSFKRINKIKSEIVITQEEFKVEEYIKIPASIFLLII